MEPAPHSMQHWPLLIWLSALSSLARAKGYTKSDVPLPHISSRIRLSLLKTTIHTILLLLNVQRKSISVSRLNQLHTLVWTIRCLLLYNCFNLKSYCWRNYLTFASIAETGQQLICCVIIALASGEFRLVWLLV